MSSEGNGTSNVTMMRLEYPQTSNEIVQLAAPRLDTIEIRDPPAWLRQLVYQHEQAKRDLQRLYELSGNRLDENNPRIRAIEQNYTTIYRGLQYLYEQGKKDSGASREWVQTELAHTAYAAQCFTEDVWNAILTLTTDPGERQHIQQLQRARNSDVIAFLHSAGTQRDQELANLPRVVNDTVPRVPAAPETGTGAPGPSTQSGESARTMEGQTGTGVSAQTAHIQDPDFFARLAAAITTAQAATPVTTPPKRANTAKMRMDNPAKFDGKPKTQFRLWWESVQEYVAFYPETEGTQWISWVGTLLTDEAKAWHHHRRRVLRTTDTWAAYQAAIQAEYHDPREAANAHAGLSRLRYKGDIKAYFNEFRTLNLIAGATGQGLQEKIDLAMPDDILDMRAAQFRGVLVADEDFLAATEEAGLQVERNKALKVMRKELKGHPFSSGTERENPKREGKSEARTNPRTSPTGPRATGRRIYATLKDALAGLDLAELEDHKTTKAGCWRCGRDGHQATDCYARTTRKGTPLPAAPGNASAVSKRKNDSTGEENDTTAKKIVTTAAVLQSDEGQGVPLWAEDSEEDF